jgi:hypothetical protein
MSDLKVFFMKKLWVDAIPGEEVTADVKFHFPQVGYHSYSMYINIFDELYKQSLDVVLLYEDS